MLRRTIRDMQPCHMPDHPQVDRQDSPFEPGQYSPLKPVTKSGCLRFVFACNPKDSRLNL